MLLFLSAELQTTIFFVPSFNAYIHMELLLVILAVPCYFFLILCHILTASAHIYIFYTYCNVLCPFPHLAQFLFVFEFNEEKLMDQLGFFTAHHIISLNFCGFGSLL